MNFVEYIGTTRPPFAKSRKSFLALGETSASDKAAVETRFDFKGILENLDHLSRISENQKITSNFFEYFNN